MEEWRPLPGYEGYYEISNMGGVRSLPREIKHYTGCAFMRKGRTLKNIVCGRYLTVNLSKEGRVKTHLLHCLVAEAFLGPRPTKHQVRHLDGNGHNPVLLNLAYGTAVDNADDTKQHGRTPKGESHGMAKLTREQVKQIRALRGKLTHKQLSEKFGICTAQVGNVIYKKQWIDS